MAYKTLSVSLGTMIDDVEDILYDPQERPTEVTLDTAALADGSDTSFEVVTADTGRLHEGQFVQHDQELMLCTDKTSATPPVYTVIRQWQGSPTAGAVPAGDTLQVEPKWKRYKIADVVEKAIRRVMQRYLPIVTQELTTPETNYGLASLPATTLRVLDCHYITSQSGRWQPMDQWRPALSVPTTVVSTGKAIRIPTRIADDVSLYVDVVHAYQWDTGNDSPASEADTISLPFGGEDLPALYAAARLVTGREISKHDLDRVQEWNQEAAIREGVSLRLVRTLWDSFYRTLDDAMNVQPIPEPAPVFRRKQRYGREVPLS